MKRLVFVGLICVIFIFTTGVGLSFDFNDECILVSSKVSYEELKENIEFSYNGRIFNYNLIDNIKTSSQFDIDYQINRYNRFDEDKRRELLSHMLAIGVSDEIAIRYLFPNIEKTIEKAEKNIYIKAKDAKLKIDTNTNKVFFITSETYGVRLDKARLYHQIVEKYLQKQELTIKLPIITDKPNILSSDYERYSSLRADFSTDISRSSEDRKHNVKTALNSLNKVEILPNEVFSFNKVVGRRTEANGYRQAKIIVNNEFVDGLGGGVCQVSSTLYNSALLAGLDIVEANKHSKQISYVKYGFDAMVNFGSSDLKIRNNTNEKVIIITNFTNNRARIRIFGSSLGDTNYKLINEIDNIVEPIEEIRYDEAHEYLDKVEYTDESFYLKRGSRGMNIRSYREKIVNGELKERKLLRTDKYQVQNAVKIYGTKNRTEELCDLAA